MKHVNHVREAVRCITQKSVLVVFAMAKGMTFQDVLSAKAEVKSGFKTVRAAIRQFLVIILAVMMASLTNGVVLVAAEERKDVK
ncbi:MAG: hypothetical protein IKH61_04965 [Bacteroidales bacterium]|nr:hypothetical protein [Bacteroidales bacterium]